MKKTLVFPAPSGIKVNMMPFVQGDPDSLPPSLVSYRDCVERVFLKKGDVGFLTIDESFVYAGTSQRGYNSKGAKRNVHIEVGIDAHGIGWGAPSPSWGGRRNVTLDPSTKVLIANSLAGTCRVWPGKEDRRPTPDGDLSDRLSDYPEHTGRLLQAGEVVEMSIFTPHECIPQKESGMRQFFRIVGKGVKGRESYFTENPVFLASSPGRSLDFLGHAG